MRQATVILQPSKYLAKKLPSILTCACHGFDLLHLFKLTPRYLEEEEEEEEEALRLVVADDDDDLERLVEDEEEEKQCVFDDDTAEADWFSSFNTSSHNSFKV